MTDPADPDPPPDGPAQGDGRYQRLLASPIVRAILWPALFFGVGGLEPPRPAPKPPKLDPEP